MSNQEKHRKLDQSLQAVSLHDARAGWKGVMNSAEINAACNRWLEKNDPAFAKSRRKKFGQF